jgi:hypothetical protein
MSKLNQRESVYVSTMNVLADKSINFDDGQTPTAAELVTKDMRQSIVACVTQSIISGETEFSAEATAKHDTEAKVRGYVSGLVNNWFRKDTRLNGNVKYTVKSPGSRAGAGDEQLKALKALRSTKADDQEALQVIDAAIEARKSDLKLNNPWRALTQEQVDALPQSVREALGI